MVDYNVVSYCRRCNKRMVHPKKQGPAWYCPECREQVEKARQEEAEREKDD